MEEMKKLRDMLNNRHITWTDHSDLSGVLPIIRTWFEYGGIQWSCVYGRGSYGYADGLLELWALNQHEEPIGYLTANEVIEIIKKRGTYDRNN